MSQLSELVYQTLRRVPKGKVTTYKDLALAAGTTAYRAVGTAMKHNPFAPTVPCHRVVKSDGSLGGFMGKLRGEAIEKKRKLLLSEGIGVKDNKIVDFERVKFKW